MKQNLVITILLSILLHPLLAHTQESKIVGLIQVRNESNIIANYVRTIAPYIDELVMLDDGSIDNTVKIAQTISEKINLKLHTIKNKTSVRINGLESNNYSKLLLAGRIIGGTHFIFLDADEAFTANCMDNDILKKRILSLQPGQSIAMPWLQLWRGFESYRIGNEHWSMNRHIPAIFCDDGFGDYNRMWLHLSRIPKLSGRRFILESTNFGIMHFQFVNWQNLLLKQAWYRCLEIIRWPKKPISLINEVYGNSTNEKNVELHPISHDWFDNYRHFFDFSAYDKPCTWRQENIVEWFEKYGIDYFKELDIWNIEFIKKAGERYH